jgi:predicted ArsR family transcriptional regulator
MGVSDDLARGLVAKLALDGMTKTRRAVVELLISVRPTVVFTTSQVGDAVGLPTGAANRALEDLAAHGVVERHSGYRGSQHGWTASAWLREHWAALDLPVTTAISPDPEEQW